jgi:hypothetical protein
MVVRHRHDLRRLSTPYPTRGQPHEAPHPQPQAATERHNYPPLKSRPAQASSATFWVFLTTFHASVPFPGAAIVRGARDGRDMLEV